MALTLEERNTRQRDYRRKNSNACTNKYEKTKKGFLVRKYRNMLSRVTGVQHEKEHLYLGLSILNKEDFHTWANDSKVFLELFKAWEEAEYDRKLCPTVDRIDSSRGYDLDNMEWITHSENSRRGSLSRDRKRKENETLSNS